MVWQLNLIFLLNNANKLDWIMMRDMSNLGEALTQIAPFGL